MIKVRKGTFETNSSSTHSLVMCSKDEYDLLKKNEAFLVREQQIVTKEDLFEKFINKNEYNQKYWKEYCDKYLKNYESLDDLIEMILLDPSSYDDEDEDELSRPFDVYDICTLDQFFDNEYLESFEDSYTTKSGEEVIAFGLYGYDG